LSIPRLYSGRKTPKNPSYLLALGAALYRAGKYGPAVKRLKEAQKHQGPEKAAATDLFLAMAYHRGENPRQARRAFRTGSEWVKRNDKALPWDQRLELKLLCEEAAALLEGGPKK
jgi:Flp pilus assembly protein TadD